MKYLAKSNPPETIEEHTLNLLKNYYLLYSIYPEIQIDWNLLKLAVIYHDMGKINDKFQKKIYASLNNEYYKDKNEIPHGYLSIGFVDYSMINDDGYEHPKIRSYSKYRASILATSIFFHHNRKSELLRNEIIDICDYLEDELSKLKDKNLDFESEELKNVMVRKIPSLRIFDYTLNKVYITSEYDLEQKEQIYIEYCKIKGLLNKLDYAASAHEKIEYVNDFIEAHMQKMLNNFKKHNAKADWNALQKYMIKNRNENIIAIAQTGMGKTEAGLLWIGNNKGYFTLPLKTAINSIYNRIISGLDGDISKQVALLHSDTASQYLYLGQVNEEINFDLEDYIFRTKQLSMPITICTIDQLFDFVYLYSGSEIKLATLSYSKIIIDEIQMYNSKLLATVLIALKWIVKSGGKFAILTATMPPFLIDMLNELELPYKLPQPFIDDTVRHSLQVIEDNINGDFVLKIYEDNKILVICNTVKMAQKLYRELNNNYELSGKLHIFHSGFIKKDRQKIEKELLNFTKKSNSDSGIWICTQVVEASLDVDFDVLITEMSDINGLFQRLGRCYRKRNYTKSGYNCFVFVGDDIDLPSGIGSVVDRDIFKLSKTAIMDIDGKLDESKKQEIINRVYALENVKNTDFYKNIRNTMQALDYLNADEMDKAEVSKIFRNINSIDIMPESIYLKNKNEIEKCAEVLKMRFEDVENIEQLKKEKIKAKDCIDSFMVGIPLSEYSKVRYESVDLTKYIKVIVADIEYDSELGINKIITKEKYKTEDILNRMV